MDIVSKSYILNNLNCAHCAGKIEEEVGKIKGVKKHQLNFVKKLLRVDVEKKGAEDIIEDIHKKIVEIESVVEIEEHVLEGIERKFKLGNLFCASCAGKVEKAILDLDEVNNGSYNFSTQILKLNLDKKVEVNSFVAKIQGIIDSIEDGVEVSYITKEVRKKEKKDEVMDKKELIQNLIGFAMFIGALFIKEEGLLRNSLFTISYVLVGGDVVLRAFKNLKGKNLFDENFLMTIATFGAFGIGEYPEAAAVMIFYKVGEFFQSKAVARSRESIEDLMDIRPDYANLLVNGRSEKVDPEDVSVGDIVLINPGEKIPLDGEVVKGESTLDTSALTGESLPRKVRSGSVVLSGAINKSGSLQVRVTRAFYDSTANKILELVENASANKAETEKFITKFSKYYTPIVVIIATLVAVVPSILYGSFDVWLYRALIFLVISCPCALVVSVPLGFFGGIGRASRKGVLVKGSNYLEALNKLESVIFDKTGTLTEGKFRVVEVDGKEDILEYAAYAELNSNHPIATSIKEHYGRDLERSRVGKYEEIEGYGVKVEVDGKVILAGNKKLMDKEGIECSEGRSFGTIVYVAKDNEYLGNIVIRDEIKEDSREAIKALKKLGKKVFMLTGDNKKVAETIANELGIDKVYSDLLPHEKVSLFDKVKGETAGLVAFVGDGINDAPVLAKADIGISMGGLGSDAAIEASDIVLMEDRPSRIATSVEIAKKTRKIVLQNIAFALAVKVIIMSLGVLGNATMWEAIFADVGVALIAIINSTRALRD